MRPKLGSLFLCLIDIIDSPGFSPQYPWRAYDLAQRLFLGVVGTVGAKSRYALECKLLPATGALVSLPVAHLDLHAALRAAANWAFLARLLPAKKFSI